MLRFSDKFAVFCSNAFENRFFYKEQIWNLTISLTIGSMCKILQGGNFATNKLTSPYGHIKKRRKIGFSSL